MDADLTVIIPLYNQEKYIRECIESVCNQVIDGLQIVVVNDGSTDSSLEICNELARQDSRIQVITQNNRGLAGARLTGIQMAATKYITFVDADDFITPNAYDDAEEYMESDYDQIFYKITRYYDDGRVKCEKHIFEPGIYDRKRIINEIYPRLIWDFTRNTPGIECSQCVRITKKDILLDAYNRLKGKRFYYGEDWAITLPLMIHMKKLAIIDRSFYMHRLRPNNGAPEYIKSLKYFDEILKLHSFLEICMSEETEIDFVKQLDYLYIYSVEQKKWCYEDYEFHRDFLFPFDKVEHGKRIILYGAGTVGKAYYKQVRKLNYCLDIIWVDRSAERINNQDVASVTELDKMEYRNYDYVVIAIENCDIANEIRDYLIMKGYDEKRIVW